MMRPRYGVEVQRKRDSGNGGAAADGNGFENDDQRMAQECDFIDGNGEQMSGEDGDGDGYMKGKQEDGDKQGKKITGGQNRMGIYSPPHPDGEVLSPFGSNQNVKRGFKQPYFSVPQSFSGDELLDKLEE